MHSKFLCTDVLAIRCIGDFVFVGIGCTLNIFNKVTFELVTKVKCLYPNNIHGILNGPNNMIAIFGAKSISIYNFSMQNGNVTLKECMTKQFNDWIITVRWVTIDDQNKLCILFAHNNVCLQNISNKDYSNIHCKEKCILYSGFISTQSNNITIFGGTVFREILIWEIPQDSQNFENVPILHRLPGHNGVIFSIIYEPRKRLICSTSDDRTVRLWNVIDDDSTNTSIVNWGKSKVKLTKTMFGHVARVWRSVIWDDCLITIGEDSLLCTWSLDGKLLNKVYAHHGAAIWSVEISDDGKSIYTGGADGAVNVWSFKTNYIEKRISLSTTVSSNVPKYVFYLISGTLLILNESGVLFCYTNEEECPREMLVLQRYSSYCIMNISPCRSYVCLASRDGYISIYKEVNEIDDRRLRHILEEKVMESQIFSLQWLKNDTIIACGSNGTLKVFTFTMDDSIHILSEYLLPPSRECWLTAATVYQKLLICGGRSGNLYVYNFDECPSDEDEVNSNRNPVQTFSKVHGKIGVQTFTVFGDKLMSAGRDGTLRFYEVREEEKKKLLFALHKEKMPMDWISSTLTLPSDVLIVGFKEVEFLVYSMNSRRIVARILCGGGHRSWDCIYTGKSLVFAYVRNKQIYLFDQPLLCQKLPIMLNGFHEKGIYCIKPLGKFNEDDIVISGGEDGSLRVTSIFNISGNDACHLKSLGIFNGHLSSIRCLAIKMLSIATNLYFKKYLVFSGGGRAQIKVWEICIKHNKDSLTDLSCSDVTSHMLFGQDHNRKKDWRDPEKCYVIEPETRYMDMEVYQCPQQPKRLLLFVGCGDGCLRIFLYDCETRCLSLKMRNKDVDRCILKVHIFIHDENVIVLTMSTDGVVRFYDCTNVVAELLKNKCSGNEETEIASTLRLFAQVRLHQSGINAFDLKVLNKNEYILATGGDDNLFSLIIFRFAYFSGSKIPASISILSKFSENSAHSAQITGIKFKGKDQIYSVGIDQKIIVYSYEYGSENVSAEILSCVYTSVSDVQGMILDCPAKCEEQPFVCIYGNGVEILEQHASYA